MGKTVARLRDLETAFFKIVNRIRDAADERDLYNIKSLHFEKLKGEYEGYYSVRLNIQYRLLLEIEKDTRGNLIIIIKIIDYHK